MNNGMAAQSGWSYTDSDWLLDEHGKFEIINGGLYLTPWLSPAHQDLSACVFIELSAFAKRERVGRVLFRPPLVFADADYLVPDIAVFPGQRAPYARTESPGPLAQLVVEVLSKFTETRDRGISASAMRAMECQSTGSLIPSGLESKSIGCRRMRISQR
ncbi:MAG TPA: Uma2 family endonuclease [Longimicrobium sp.]|jgi:Uma2 family endonuclease